MLYLGLNQAIYGDPFIFMQIQKDHWSQSFGFFGQTMVTSLNYALYYDEWLYRICLFIPQTALMVIMLITLPCLLRRMTAADAVYSVAYVLCIMSPTWLLSFPRYLMGMATLYPAMARGDTAKMGTDPDGMPAGSRHDPVDHRLSSRMARAINQTNFPGKMTKSARMGAFAL